MSSRGRMLHDKGLCGRCGKPARKRADGLFYWHCPPCQRKHSKQQQSYKRPAYKRTPKLIMRARLAQSMLFERRAIDFVEQSELSHLISELRDRILYLERRVEKLKAKKAGDMPAPRAQSQES